MRKTNYSIVVMSGEQQNMRHILGKLAQCLCNAAWKNPEGISLNWLAKTFNKLMMIDRYCHERKIELYVIPAIRKVSTEADALLARLDTLSMDAVRILRYAYDQIQRVADGDEADIPMLIAAMELYCNQVLERLTLEEDELFPLARHLLSEADWLCLAACCLSRLPPPGRASRHENSIVMGKRSYRHTRYVH